MPKLDAAGLSGGLLTCSALSVAEVALGVQLPPDHQRADIAAAHLHGLPALQQHHRDAGLCHSEGREQACRTRADDNYRVSTAVLG